MGLRNSGGPGEAWKTELHHQPSLQRRVETGEGSPQRPPPPRPSAIQLHSSGSTQNAAPSSPAPLRPGEGILRGSFPLQPEPDIPTPTRGCLSAVAECHCSLFLPIRVDTAPKASPPQNCRGRPRVRSPGEGRSLGPSAAGGGRV